jgi:hypothetical protein
MMPEWNVADGEMNNNVAASIYDATQHNDMLLPGPLTQAVQAAGTEEAAAVAEPAEPGAAPVVGWVKRASADTVVAEVIGVVEVEVAVSGLPQDTDGEALVEAAESGGAVAA